MKTLRLFITIAIICSTSPFYAQKPAEEDTSYWNGYGNIGLNFTQISLTNWSQGGQNAISGIGQVDLALDFEKGKKTWENSIYLGYGTIRSGGEWRKNEDKIDFQSQFGYQAADNFAYSTLAHFKSQFTEGYNYPDDSNAISDFMAPASLLVSIGMDYKPWKFLSLYISPATGKATWMLGDKVDETRYGLDQGETARYEFGAYLTAEFKKEVLKNTSLKSKLELFNNYTDPNKPNRKNIDVDWETTINLQVNDYISANLFTRLIYDHDIDIPKTDDEGNEYLGKGTQFKEVLGVGFSYKFD